MEQEQPKPKFEWVKPKEVPEVYGNFFNVSWTLFDVRFLIGQLVPKGQDQTSQFVVEQRAAVTIAWAEAKVLRDILSELVAKYEQANGEIKQLHLPPAT
jgi:Protein of unknown function (DUF3467)